jgi:hypothetical protein
LYIEYNVDIEAPTPGKKAAATSNRSVAAKKAAATRKHRAAGNKAAKTRMRKVAAKKAVATRARKKQAASAPPAVTYTVGKAEITEVPPTAPALPQEPISQAETTGQNEPKQN